MINIESKSFYCIPYIVYNVDTIRLNGGSKEMNITDLARDELNKVLQTQEANGIRVYFNGFG